MGGLPFSEKDRSEIASLCAEVFNGRAGATNDVCIEYAKWLPYIVQLYLPLIDSESGDFLHFPYPGSLVEQPHITMETLRLVQLNYRIAVREQMKRQSGR